MSTAPVSAVIPVYNGERYVGAAIESALGQTRPPAEILVVDDGSTDDSARIAAAFGERVRLLQQANAGVSAARNRGVQCSRQPHVAFLDHDDLWLPYKLEQQLAALEADPGLGFVFCGVEQFVSPEVAPEKAGRFHVDLRACAVPLTSALLMRREAFERVGMFVLGSDAGAIDWLLRAQDLGVRSRALPQTLVRRRVHGANRSYRNGEVVSDYLRFLKASLDRRRATPATRRLETGA
jgi:glycosyltransferase involved in cell wall biosynthesis